MNGQLGAKQEGKAGPIQTGQSSPGTDPKPRVDCVPRRGCLTLDPSGNPHHRWLLAMVAPILYNWIILICRSCFPELQRKHRGLWLGLDSLSDLLYLLDMLVHLCTGYLEEGVLIRDPPQVAQRYLCSASFRWDVASVLPTELLYLLPGGTGVPGVRANRLLRTPRLLEALDRIETRTAHPHAFRLSKLMAYVFVALHWNACLYFALSAKVGFGADAWVLPNASVPGFDRLLRQYLHCVYFSTLVLTTVGDTPTPQRWEEFLFMAADLLLAVLAFATIVGSVASVVSGRSKARAAIYPDQDPVKGYLRTLRVDPRLQRRVAAWHQHLRMNQKATGEGQILRPLSERLQAQVAISVHLPALRQVRLFQHCEQSLLEALVLKLRPQVYSPGEFVCRKGEVGHEMYFIREGRLAVVADDGLTQYAVLGEGLYFGEISIIHIAGNQSGNRRTASIRSLGFSDLFSLSKEDLAEVLSEFPQAKALLEAKGREILLQMGKLDLSAEAAEVARRQREERQAAALGEGLEALQTQLARVLAGLESSAFKMAVRLERLEWQWQAWREGAAET